MSKICDTCETAIHCAKYGCIPERIGSKPAQEFVCSTGLCHYRKPLTDELENAFKDGWNAAKAAHGIKENT